MSITVGYSTRKHNPEFIEYLKKSSGFKKINVIEKINNGEKSLSQVYNEILNESETEVVVLCHDDIYFDSTSWYHKILKHFEKNDYGILGVAGTTFMSESGMWWEDRKKMFGIVNHEHGGKKWQSKYSEDLGKKIKQTIIVDGLFMAIHKKRIKESFDETVDGFHFYDINFCFPNYLKNVKIGVVTDIRITHKSIGATDQSWENNRLLFSAKYKENLPCIIPYENDSKLKVLIGCLFFQNFTGSELYVYELAKNLIKMNCEVSVIAAHTTGPLVEMANVTGIKVYNVNTPPHFFIGDGETKLNTPNGQITTQKNTPYQVSEISFDIIHVQHKPISELLCNLYPKVTKISTIHSEIISLEEPYINPQIKKYIAIRPEIKDHIIQKHGLDENIVEIIYNPIDENRFTSDKSIDGNYTLFVGGIDYLRLKTVEDLIDKVKNENSKLYIVGDDKINFLTSDLYTKNTDYIQYFKSTYHVEKYIKNCKETAGIQLGRTTIESWMCGKPSWIYNVDENGFILKKELHEVPSDIQKYYSTNVARKIKENYIQCLNKL